MHFVIGASFHRENLPREGIFLEVRFPGKIFLRGLTEFPYEILFLCLKFSLRTKFCMCRYSEGIIRGTCSFLFIFGLKLPRKGGASGVFEKTN